MSEKEYREVRVSPIQLIVIFLGLIIMGIAIFILGVSVGKKQAQMKKIPEEVVVEKKLPEKKEEKSEKKYIALEQKTQKDTFVKKREEVPETIRKGLYYIPVGKYTSSDNATAVANKYIELGYKAFVFEPFIGDKSPIYRVRIGGFESKEEALKTKEKIELLEKRKLFIVKE